MSLSTPRLVKKVQGIILDNADSTASVAAVEKSQKSGHSGGLN